MKQTPPPLYALLEVDPSASLSELRTAYRRLAKKYHPDTNPGDSEATERFKQISAAYQVLGNPELRRSYDRSFAFKVNAGAKPRPAARPRTGVKGGDIKIKLNLDLAEAVRGGYKTLRYPRNTPCPVCGGTGRSAQSQSECGNCSGRGGVQGDHTVKLAFKAGVRPGGVVRVIGGGNSPGPGSPPGDLVVTINIKKHPYFEIAGGDLHYRALLNLEQIIEGGKLRVPTLKRVTGVDVPPRFPDGGILRLKGKGLPPHDGAPAGDIVVRVHYCLPKRLSRKERDRIIELQKLPGFSPAVDEQGLLVREDSPRRGG